MTREQFFARLGASLLLSPTACWKWRLEQGRHTRVSIAGKSVPAGVPVQLALFAQKSEVEKRIETLDVDALAPIDALLLLRELKRIAQQ